MKARKRTASAGTIILLIPVIGIVPLLPMIISGDWGWIEAWLYAFVFIFGFIISRILVGMRNPDLIRERAGSFGKEDAKTWDKILAPLVAYGNLFLLVTAGLDRRFGLTSTFGTKARTAGLLIIVSGFVFGSWALIENRFFSGVVRIQTDRGHRVVDSGPYRILRHPGYAGTLWTYLATPLLLDSLWAFIPAAVISCVLILRTSLEDRTLKEGLEGYSEYAKRTRFRLFWGIW